MKENSSVNRINLVNWICALIVLVMVVLLFLPYWQYDGQSTSINSYVWFPTDQGPLNAYFESELGAPVDINGEIGTPIFILVAGVVCLVLQIVYRNPPIISIGGIAIGIVGIMGYLSSAALRLGALWGLHLALCIAAVVFGVLSLLGRFGYLRQEYASQRSATIQNGVSTPA